MAHLVQVGAGSGGMPVLDMLARDPRITRVTLIEPDVYKPHNVVRHCFPPADIGQPKAALARNWLRSIRDDLDVHVLEYDLLDPAHAANVERAVAAADVGVCAADNEQAKFHWDSLMRRHGKPWTLGEVLSGGIGGFVHWFTPGGPCYGCVASHLQRTVTTEKPSTPDYSQPGGLKETTIPASKTSILIIAGLHAQVTLQLLRDGASYSPGFTSLLLTLERVEGIFEEAFRPFRINVPRAADCLMCRPQQDVADLDRALNDALTRLSDGGA
jgi:molybdopterin/thiamine biosynthesis adenylyltransferase